MSGSSPASREASRERALALHAEPHPDDPTRRKFGGRQPGAGRPRTVRASELVAAAAQEHADELIAALLAGVREQENPDKRSRAADRWVRLALQQEALTERFPRPTVSIAELPDRSELEARFVELVAAAIQEGRVRLPTLPHAND